jgi:hypothetical protein
VVVSSQRYGVDGSYDLLSDLLEANGNSAFADLTYSADPAIRNEALRVKLQRAINYDSYQRFGRVSFSQLESFSDGLSSLFGSSRAANMQHLGRRYGFSEFATSVFSTDVRSDWLEGLARDNREFVDSMRGWSRHEALNVGTDVLLNGMDLITANGVNIISGANGLVSLFDQRYARQIGGALSHPGQLYQGAVQGMSEWFELSPGEKARGAGLVGMGLLAGGEISAASGRALPRVVANSTQVANLRRLDVDDVNAEFTSRGQYSPYDQRVDVREFDAASDLNFVRVHNANNPRGAWMVRADEIAGMTPTQIQRHLALPEMPTHVQSITVPAGHTLRAGRVGPQPQWGAPNPKATQYQSPSFLPDSAFGPSRELTQ